MRILIKHRKQKQTNNKLIQDKLTQLPGLAADEPAPQTVPWPLHTPGNEQDILWEVSQIRP